MAALSVVTANLFSTSLAGAGGLIFEVHKKQWLC